MSDDQNPLTQREIEDRIEKVGRYSRYAKAGITVIMSAFILAVIAVLPANLDSIAVAVNAILLPLIFIGMGLLLFGIAMHLHLMHLNLVDQLRRRREQENQPPSHDSES